MGGLGCGMGHVPGDQSQWETRPMAVRLSYLPCRFGGQVSPEGRLKGALTRGHILLLYIL